MRPDVQAWAVERVHLLRRAGRQAVRQAQHDECNRGSRAPAVIAAAATRRLSTVRDADLVRRLAKTTPLTALIASWNGVRAESVISTRTGRARDLHERHDADLAQGCSGGPRARK